MAPYRGWNGLHMPLQLHMLMGVGRGLTCGFAICCCCCLRRRATTTINDGASIPDTLNTPRSSIDPVSQEVLMDLLDTWGAR
jgi:hypothetical protein